ncbi:MAG: hypothetical protein K2W81_02050 [Sphingomonas sp.]|uniref:hypothetical protein n=1 Tax=Sphingomonas sp. TaxID=28214 RepID=UPI0025F9CCCD|nr:hypothetical protein [Sphingomonas sp.]MBY0282730.1 hypothetical protein [Sphingomonas sp.]
MHYRNRRKIILGATTIAAAALSGCATPKHTNLLMFGTNTVIGLKVGADATQTPAIQLAYSRQELVLMPLLANTSGKGADLTPCPATESAAVPAPGCKFVGEDGATIKDSYSVFASFGAKGNASKMGGDAKAGGAIAQYFATGLAARELAKHGSALVAASESATAEANSSYSAAFAAEVVESADKGRAAFASAVEKLDDQTYKTKLQKADDAITAGGKFVRACSATNTAAACAAVLKSDGNLRNITGDRWDTAVKALS